MFRMDISMAVFLYVMSSLGITFLLWIAFEKRAAFPKYVREEANVWECRICAYTYVDSQHHDISQCPQCKSWNKKDAEERFY